MDSPMCNYLVKRGTKFYFRRAIPLDLRPALGGRREWMFSLQTSDKQEGQRQAHILAVKYDQLISSLRSADITPPAPPPSKSAVSTGFTTEVEYEHYLAQVEADQLSEWAYDEREPARQAIISGLELSDQKLSVERQALKDIISDLNFEINLANERAMMSATVSPADVPEAKEIPSGAMMMALIDKWAAERKPNPKTIDAHRALAKWLYERVGEIPVAALTRKDVLTFKDKLIAEGTTLANVKTKLSRLRTLLAFAQSNDLAEINAAEGITVTDPDAAKRKRRPFDVKSLTTIFESPVYSADQRPAAGRGEAAYWLPLLALYTGARLEELGQLRPQDVMQEQYVGDDDAPQTAWVLNLTEDLADGLKLKNAGSERKVPIHPSLVELGFIRLVEDARSAVQPRIFHALKPDKYGRFTAKWGEWFGSYLREVCGITDPRLVFHSFRHSWKHYARDAGIMEGVQRQIMGHTSGDVADDYGDGYSVYQVVEGMKRYRIRGFKLPRPPPAYR
jgi:integrase